MLLPFVDPRLPLCIFFLKQNIKIFETYKRNKIHILLNNEVMDILGLPGKIIST